MSNEKAKEYLRKQFKSETNTHLVVGAREPYISHIQWLEDKIIDTKAENASLKERVKEESMNFAKWVEELSPANRVSMWSKNGEYKGLFTMDYEQLYDKWKLLTNNQQSDE